MCQAFSLFLLVCEKTHPKVGQWKIFVVASEVNTSREIQVMMASIGPTQLTGLDRTSAQDGLS